MSFLINQKTFKNRRSKDKAKFILLFILISCFIEESFASLYDFEGNTINSRFKTPEGFSRIVPPQKSFGEFLQNYKIKPEGTPVHLFNGKIKQNKVWAAVLDMPIIEKDLIQCADAIIKLRAEYFYEKGEYENIIFTLTNGMVVPYRKYIEGYRIKVAGNKSEWVKTDKKGESRKIFEEYLEFIYTYCGTASLQKDTVKGELNNIEIGDIFLEAGSPGHAVIVVDLAQNEKGEKIMLLAQSYMPSQEMHILKSGEEFSPWYKVEDTELKTAEWIFPKGSLRKWK